LFHQECGKNYKQGSLPTKVAGGRRLQQGELRVENYNLKSVPKLFSLN
jgi:hypothetical protein